MQSNFISFYFCRPTLLQKGSSVLVNFMIGELMNSLNFYLGWSFPSGFVLCSVEMTQFKLLSVAIFPGK